MLLLLLLLLSRAGAERDMLAGVSADSDCGKSTVNLALEAACTRVARVSVRSPSMFGLRGALMCLFLCVLRVGMSATERVSGGRVSE